MKKLILSAVIFLSLAASAQDTTIATLSTKSRYALASLGYLRGRGDTAALNLYNRWIAVLPANNLPGINVQVSVDSIKVVVIADLYERFAAYPQATNAAWAGFASDILTIRNANTFLDRLCDAVDAGHVATKENDDIKEGKKIVKANNQ